MTKGRIPINSKGMTIIEVMIVIMVLSIVSTSLFALITHSIDGWSIGTSYDSAISAPTIAMQKLSNEIRNGRSAIATSGCLIVTYPSKITDPLTNKYIYDPSANSPVTVSYYIDGNSNLVKYSSGTTTVIAKGISSAIFGANGGLVNITLKAKDRTGSAKNQVTQQVNGSISLRNYKG